MAAATQAVSWESAAMVFMLMSGSATIITGLGYAVSRIIKAVKSPVSSEVTESVERQGQRMIETLKDEVWKANGVLIAFFNQINVPMWVKEVVYLPGGAGYVIRMKTINPGYTALFGVTQQQYHGKEDHKIWPADVAIEFRKHDVRVVTEGVRIEMIESFPDIANIDYKGPMRPWRVVKFPIRDSVSDRVIAVAGYCVPLEMSDALLQAMGNIAAQKHVIEQ